MYASVAGGDQTTDGYLQEIADIEQKTKQAAEGGLKLPVPKFLNPKGSAEEAEKEEEEKIKSELEAENDGWNSSDIWGTCRLMSSLVVES